MRLFAPIITKQTYTEEQLEFNWQQLEKALLLLEHRLKKTRYLCGDQISIADLAAACELDHGRFIKLDDDYLDTFPLVKAWKHRVIDENPIVLEIH